MQRKKQWTRQQNTVSNTTYWQTLQKNRNEVRDLILTEYNEKKHMEMERRTKAGRIEEGIQKGLEEGIQKGLKKVYRPQLIIC